jgi:ABC-type amino acid transport substrate-binding protein
MTCIVSAWDRIIPGLVARKFELIVASMAITEQRRQRVDFSDKYSVSNPAICARW